MPDTALPTLPEQANEHFMEALVDLSQQQEIEVSEDVYAQNGTKLLARGARVDTRLYERVINHKLRRPIETSLVSSAAICIEDLCREAEKLIDEVPLVKNFCNWSMGRVTPLSLLGKLKFSPQAGTLLSVAEHRNPKTRAHVALVALIAMGAAHKLWPQDRGLVERVALAGLFHDIGEVYVDPACFVSSDEISPVQWQSFSAHPIIGAALAREVVGLDAECQAIILQHHERIDGAGYPRGLVGKAIGPAARVLAIAEVVAGMRGRDCPLCRIDVALKILPNEFDPGMMRLAGDFLREQRAQIEQPYQSSESTPDGIHKVFDRILKTMELLHEWSEGERRFTAPAQACVDTIIERFMRVQHAFASTGMDCLDSILSGLDAEALRETHMESACVLDEMLWRLTRLSRDLVLKMQGFSEREREQSMRLANILAGQAE